MNDHDECLVYRQLKLMNGAITLGPFHLTLHACFIEAGQPVVVDAAASTPVQTEGLRIHVLESSLHGHSITASPSTRPHGEILILDI